MDADGNTEEPSRLVLVRFKTDLGHPYKVTESSISIPANLTRFGLSTVVNNLIKSGNPDWESEPFDFLIKNELVRMSLEKFLLAKNISAERILEIEYIRAVVPRKEEEPSLHNDWVSAVDGSSPRFFLTGCYDGLGRVWKAAGACTHILEGHSEPVTSVSIINPKGGESVTVATASKDRTLRLWNLIGRPYCFYKDSMTCILNLYYLFFGEVQCRRDPTKSFEDKSIQNFTWTYSSCSKCCCSDLWKHGLFRLLGFHYQFMADK